MTDSWLIDGNCSSCRRAEYCSNECKLHKELREKELRDLVLSRTGFGFALSLLHNFNKFS